MLKYTENYFRCDIVTEFFSFSFDAVMPILILALVGYLLKCLHFADDAFFKKLNTMVFKVFLPVLLYWNVYEIESLGLVRWSAVLYCVFAVLLISLIGYGVTKLIFKDRENIGVLTQCSFRSNYAIIGIPLAESLGGAQAVAFASILSAVTIPLYNILAVIILSHYSSKNKNKSLKHILKSALTNPLIVSVALGVLTVAIREILPLNELGNPIFTLENNLHFVYAALSRLARVASPVALVVLGARFDFKAINALKKEIFTGTFMRLVFAPAFGIGLAFLLCEYTHIINLTSVEYPALIALFSTPVAVSSAVMTGEIGGNEQLAGQLVVWTSIFSMLTMFVIIFVMKKFALI